MAYGQLLTGGGRRSGRGRGRGFSLVSNSTRLDKIVERTGRCWRSGRGRGFDM